MSDSELRADLRRAAKDVRAIADRCFHTCAMRAGNGKPCDGCSAKDEARRARQIIARAVRRLAPTDREQDAARKQLRVVRGLCAECGLAPPALGVAQGKQAGQKHQRCAACLYKAKTYQRLRYQPRAIKLAMANPPKLCRSCGKRPPAPLIVRRGAWCGFPMTRCLRCVEVAHARKEKKR